MKVVVAPDSFKASMAAQDAAAAIAAGWRERRPDDDVIEAPLADGGEGTIAALRGALRGARTHVVAGVCGPAGRPVNAEFLMLPDGCAVVELASSSGLPLMKRPDPLRATTRGLGEVLAAAIGAGASGLVVGLGGSASTDGGAGALVALGLELRDRAGRPVPDGGGGLRAVCHVDASRLLPPPPGGVRVLTDVDNPLLGPYGAAAVFGPQKGAGAADIAVLEAALSHWAGLLGRDPAVPGSGAAGGSAYGLAAMWGARLIAGSDFVAAATGLDTLVSNADLVITGEGSFDLTSLSGKVVGGVLRRARRHGVPVCVVAGQVGDLSAPGLVAAVSLADMAGSVSRSRADPLPFARMAGGRLADGAEELACARNSIFGGEAPGSHIGTGSGSR